MRRLFPPSPSGIFSDHHPPLWCRHKTRAPRVYYDCLTVVKHRIRFPSLLSDLLSTEARYYRHCATYASRFVIKSAQ